MTTRTTFEYTEFVNTDVECPEHFYTMLNIINNRLPNIQKWTLISGVLDREDVDPYDPVKSYNIFDCINRHSLGQLHELRQVIPLFYTHIVPVELCYSINNGEGVSKGDLSAFSEDSSLYMAKIISVFCKEGFMYKNTVPTQPHCRCFKIDHEDETREFAYEMHNVVSTEIPKQTCKQCSGRVETYDITDEHFHLIPFLQRSHMNISSFVWVLAFMIEGFKFTYETLNAVSSSMHDITLNNKKHTHQYFKFYAKYKTPSKYELCDYQETRRIMGEHFVEIIKKTESSPDISLENNFPKVLRYNLSDEPNWWEPDYYSNSLPSSL